MIIESYLNGVKNTFRSYFTFHIQLYQRVFTFAAMFKRLTVILIISSQLALLLNKSLIVVHFFLHRAEIIEHFCHHATHEEEEKCHGICYLQAELSKDDASPVKNFPVKSLVQQDVVYFEMPPIFTLNYPIAAVKITNQYIVKTPVLHNTNLSVWRPPATA